MTDDIVLMNNREFLSDSGTLAAAFVIAKFEGMNNYLEANLEFGETSVDYSVVKNTAKDFTTELTRSIERLDVLISLLTEAKEVLLKELNT